MSIRERQETSDLYLELALQKHFHMDNATDRVQTTILIDDNPLNEPFYYFYERGNGNKLVRWSDWYDNNTIEEIN